MGWHGELRLDYRREGEHTVAHDRHHGPLRVLQRLYPEGPGICHHVLVHPPGGMVGGDSLDIRIALQPGSHAVLTTPGAARFYRSTGAAALQTVNAALADDTRLEWLPLETLAYSGCEAENRLRFELAPRAEMIGWDLLALGLPSAGQPFALGRYRQHLELPGVWLERGLIAADDALLLDSPLGLAGRTAVGSLWFAAGAALSTARREALLDGARDVAAAHPLAPWAGATAPDDRVIVLRAVAERIEPLMDLFRQVRGRWRSLAWELADQAPRIWRT